MGNKREWHLFNSRQKLNLKFGNYDSIRISIIQDTNINSEEKIKISVSPAFEYNLNCYKMYKTRTDSYCTSIKDNKPTIISKNEFNIIENEEPLMDSVKLMIYISKEFMEFDSIQYNIIENKGIKFDKAVLYSDIKHNVKPNSTWNLKINTRKILIGETVSRGLYRVKNRL